MDTGMKRGGVMWRRMLFAFLVLATVAAGGLVMTEILSHDGLNELEFVILFLFVVTFGWITLSFWTAVLGTVVSVVARFKNLSPARLATPLDGDNDGPITARIAVVVPVYKENADRVVEGLWAMHRSLVGEGQRQCFDFFLLSDTPAGDGADHEEQVFDDFQRATRRQGHSFYRRRSVNERRKVGNIEDFCRRWGGQYDFMLVLDADSVMSGASMMRLARLIEANPQVGLIQSQPMPVGQETLFGRTLQFANRLTGSILATGLAFWQGPDGNYWGHNAIVRLDAFMAHCSLPVLSGKPPLGGEILSHDFVEAAFLSRAGYEVWLLPESEGSYEEIPGDVIAFAVRDRRWCQGNLQHLRLLGLKGLKPLSRLHLGFGALAYLSSLLWLGFLMLSLADLGYTRLVGQAYFPDGYSLFPEWPQDRTGETMSLFGVTMAMLAAPRFLAAALTLADTRLCRAFGGPVKMLASTFLEFVFSALLAPIMMVHHARFSVAVLIGRTVGWNVQVRGARALSWDEAARPHMASTLVGVATAIGVAVLAPDYVWWLLPVLTGLILSIPFVWVTARPDVGYAVRRLGLFLTPEETAPPPELLHVTARSERPFGHKPSATKKPRPQSGLIVSKAFRVGKIHVSD